MATPRKRTRAVVAKATDAQALVTQMMALQADAGMTIAMRMPILLKGAFGDRSGQREANQAVSEKMSAVMESGVAATQAAAVFWWEMMLSPITRTDMGEAAARAASSTIEPFSKRTSANASRLTGGGRRRAS